MQKVNLKKKKKKNFFHIFCKETYKRKIKQLMQIRNGGKPKWLLNHSLVLIGH